MLTGQEKADLIWREGNGIRWETIAFDDIPQKLEEIAEFKQIGFGSNEVWFDKELNLHIGEPDTDYYTIYTGELLDLIRMGFVADALFNQCKTRQEVVAYLTLVEQGAGDRSQ